MIYIVMCAFIALDVITGLLKAFRDGFKSRCMRDGLVHKTTEIIIVVLARLIDFASNYLDLGFDIKLTTAVIIYIIVMEISSILENVKCLNPQLFENVKGVFKNENK